MQDFRFILEPYKGMKTRYFCPNCRKKNQLTRYIDIETGEHLSPEVGRCNREEKCGYHYTPKQYFSDNEHPYGLNDSKPKQRVAIYQKPNPQKATPYTVIPVRTLERTLLGYNQNNFVYFLIARLGKEIAEEVIALYFLGTSTHWEGATIFWQIDHKMRIRTGKVMLYNPDSGKRIRDPYPHITWVHKIGGYKKFNLQQCLFGEHLITQHPEKPIALVEGEKTAMICAGHFPEYNWLATGNQQGLTEDRVQCLKDRTIVLYPDAGKAFISWKKKAAQLKAVGNFKVSELVERWSSPEQKESGLDMADFLLEKPKSRSWVVTGQTEGRSQNIIDHSKKGMSYRKVEEENDELFFEKIRQKKSNNNLNPWPIEKVEKFFLENQIPDQPILLGPGETIIDPAKFIRITINAVKKHNGKPTYKMYFDRLIRIKEYIESRFI